MHQASMTSTIKRSIALISVPLTAAAVGCSSSGGSTPEAEDTTTPPSPVATSAAPSDAECAPATANAAAKPPSSVPTPTDATFYETIKAGSTTDYFAYSDGDDVKVRRDAIKTQLSGAGFEIKGTDAEDNEEAELEFEGKGFEESSVQVIHREGCESQLRLRFRLRG